MADAVVFTCPRCGAGLEGAADARRAHCRYCGSVVEIPGVPEPRPLAEVPRERVRSARNQIAVLRVWALGLGFIALVVALNAAKTFRHAAGEAKVALATTTPATLPDDQPHGDVTKLVAADLHALDPASVIEQAAAAVKQRGSACELTYASLGALRGGVIDATANNSVLLRWTCRRADGTTPAAEAAGVDDQWNARLDRGYLTFEREEHGFRNSPPWHEPSCPFSRAWGAAVASGVPPDALANVFYEEWAFASGKTRPAVWRLTVEGHDAYARDIDGASCEVLGRR